MASASGGTGTYSAIAKTSTVGKRIVLNLSKEDASVSWNVSREDLSKLVFETRKSAFVYTMLYISMIFRYDFMVMAKDNVIDTTEMIQIKLLRSEKQQSIKTL